MYLFIVFVKMLLCKALCVARLYERYYVNKVDLIWLDMWAAILVPLHHYYNKNNKQLALELLFLVRMDLKKENDDLTIFQTMFLFIFLFIYGWCKRVPACSGRSVRWVPISRRVPACSGHGVRWGEVRTDVGVQLPVAGQVPDQGDGGALDGALALLQHLAHLLQAALPPHHRVADGLRHLEEEQDTGGGTLKPYTPQTWLPFTCYLIIYLIIHIFFVIYKKYFFK